MSEDERVIAHLNKRADDLIAEANGVFSRLVAIQPDVDSARDQCAAAARQYAIAHGRLDERPVLLKLAARVGRRQVILIRRSEVAYRQASSEQELHQINAALFAAQITVGLGKLAEMGLSIYGWAAQSGKVLSTIEAEVQAARGAITPAAKAALEAADSAKSTIDRARLTVDGVKAAGTAGGLVHAAVDSNRSASVADTALGITQIAALVLRTRVRFKTSAKTVWDTVSLIKRARKADDLKRGISAILHELKMCMDLLKLLIDHIEKAQRQVDRSGLGSFASKAASVLSIIRDLWDAGSAFVEASKAFEEMGENLRRFEQFTASSARFLGSEQQALAALPNLEDLSEKAIERIVQKAVTYNGARLLADAARKESAKIQHDVESALVVQRRQNRLLRQALRKGADDLETMRELLWRVRAQMVDLSFVEGQGGRRAQAARQIRERLAHQRARYEPLVSDWSSVLDATATMH